MSSLTSLQQLFQAAFPSAMAKFEVPLAPMTYFKIGGPAEVLVEARSRDEVVAVVQWCAQQQVSLTILSGASNVIVPDEGLRGVVLRPTNAEYEVVADRVIRVGAGMKTALFVRKTIDDGLTGLEFFLGVPGLLGGAIYNNAHYLSDLIGTHIARVEVIDQQGQVKWLSHDECQFGYDSSRFHTSKEVIVQAEFALAAGDKVASMELITKATQYRASTQPLGEPSSGCYFRNPPNTDELKQKFPQFAQRRECPAAFFIDQAGLKGTHLGGIKVSEKHAAFLVNTGCGTAADVKQLAEQVQAKVLMQYNIKLEPEVFWLKPIW